MKYNLKYEKIVKNVWAFWKANNLRRLLKLYFYCYRFSSSVKQGYICHQDNIHVSIIDYNAYIYRKMGVSNVNSYHSFCGVMVGTLYDKKEPVSLVITAYS